MSQPMILRDKWKLFKQYLENLTYGEIINCPFCQSVDIKFEKQSEHDSNGGHVYQSQYVCNSCNATCENKQVWAKTPQPSPIKSLKGTKWRCIDKGMDEYNMTCDVIEGENNPNFNGDNDIHFKYADGSEIYMKYRRFIFRFKQIQ